MTVGIIVQARTSSQRLPGKVLAPVLDRPLLAYQLERLARSQAADWFIVATTAHPGDDAIVAVAREGGWAVFRGPEDDVMARYILAAQHFGVDVILRATADCPLIDVAYVDEAIRRFLVGGCDHLAPVGLPDGMGCEVVERRLLERLYPDCTDEEREHVTLHIRRRPDQFRCLLPDTGHGMDAERWTVDTVADLALVRHVLEAFAPVQFTLADVRDLLTAHPEWQALNATVPAGPIDREMLARYNLPSRNVAPAFAPHLGDL